MPAAPDPWATLRGFTTARIGLGRAGVSLPTAEWLRLAQAHALARDAVHEALDADRLVADLQATAFEALRVESAAADRGTYLRRPDLGRRLSARSAARLQGVSCSGIAVVLADGLSARAAQTHALPLLLALRPRLEAQGQAIGMVVLAEQARVALGDEVGQRLQAGAVLVLIGERPGLSSPDSLGAYLTWAPRQGRSDAERNCVSNIRPEGLTVEVAAFKIAWLLQAARALGATGVALKDRSDEPRLAHNAGMPIAGPPPAGAQ
jgi:ethanolamine ammonia-lyase small subunit